MIDLGFLGDTIHLVPALWELRRHFPDSALHVVTTPVGAEVLALVACVDRVWVHPLGKPSPPWWRHLDLPWQLRRQRFDLSLNFSGADRTLFLGAAVGATRRVTREARRYGRLQRWLAGELLPTPPRSLPVYEQRRRLLTGLGLDLAPTRFDLNVPTAERDWALTQGPAGAIHFSINASSPFKEWPLKAWVELTSLLLASGWPAVIATGTPHPREQERLRSLAAGVQGEGLRVLSDRLSIARLAAVVQRCALHVGTDSGVTHLAMALGIPTVSVFRDYPGLEEWRPDGARHASLTAPCACAVAESGIQPACLAVGTALCLTTIPASEVARQVRTLCEPS